MKTRFLISSSCGLALTLLLAAAPHAPAQTQGGSVTGGSVQGGSVTGGSVTGGSVTGGSVTGGSVSGGTVTPGTVTPGTVTAVADGRQITAKAVGSVSIDVKGSSATVHLDQHKLQIDKNRLALDGQPPAALPANSKKIEISVEEELIVVNADGKEVLRAKLDK